MSDLYSYNEETRTLVTATCSLIGDELHTKGNMYEVIMQDLCRCMLAAIEADDVRGKLVIGAALHIVLSSIFNLH